MDLKSIPIAFTSGVSGGDRCSALDGKAGTLDRVLSMCIKLCNSLLQ